jgi:hypothetical protein
VNCREQLEVGPLSPAGETRNAPSAGPAAAPSAAEAEPSFFLPLRRRRQQLAERLEHHLELAVVLAELAFEFVQLAGQVLVRGRDLPQAHERPRRALLRIRQVN